MRIVGLEQFEYGILVRFILSTGPVAEYSFAGQAQAETRSTLLEYSLAAWRPTS